MPEEKTTHGREGSQQNKLPEIVYGDPSKGKRVFSGDYLTACEEAIASRETLPE